VDKDTQDLVKAASQGVAQGTTEAFLLALFGPAVEAMAIFTDKVRLLRWKRQVKMLARAHAHLRAQGISPNAVSLKVLVPLLDYASLEDEEDDAMIERWAALLANAAAGTDGASLLPSFPRILAELSPEEALILDMLYRDSASDDVPSLHSLYVPESGLNTADPLFVARCFNLDRLGLLRASYENVQIAAADPARYKHTIARLEGTALGLSFLTACSPPGARQHVPQAPGRLID
jgi:Abortive infection alpha